MIIEHPKISIVLPFHHAGPYLTEAIESILDQDASLRWELFLINDGSDCEDVRIARRYEKLLPKLVRVLEHRGGRKRGTSASRNLGIRSSSGEFVAFLDADDTWYPHKLRVQTALLERHPKVEMVFGPALRWWSWKGGRDVLVPATVDGFGTDCVVPGEALLETYLRDESLTPCTGSVLIRRSTLMKLGGFEEQFTGLYDDQVLYAKLCLSGSVFASSDCVSRYRQHAGSCCGKAESDGTGAAARERFLEWLRCLRMDYGSELVAKAYEREQRIA